MTSGRCLDPGISFFEYKLLQKVIITNRSDIKSPLDYLNYWHREKKWPIRQIFAFIVNTTIQRISLKIQTKQ